MSQPTQREPVRIVEVGPRDGLQNVKQVVPTAIKLDLINRLHDAGLRTVEVTSVVSPRAIPQLSDCRTVLADRGVQRLLGDTRFRMPVLVPNMKGLEVAMKHNVREVAVFVSATEGFSKANINCSVQQGLDRAREVSGSARKNGLAVRGYVSCIFACPYDGPTPLSAVLNCTQQLLAMGCYEVSLGDTLGVGVASDVQRLVSYLKSAGVSIDSLAGHFHDTYGQAVANVWAAYQCGMRVFDSSVGGLGGCPYAPGAKGNVATEDLVYMLQQAGIETGVDLAKLVKIGVWISKELSKSNESRAGNALATRQKRAVSVSSAAKDPQQDRNPASLLWASYKSREGLEILRSGTNVKIILNRPRNGNTLTTSMISSLTSFFETAAIDPSITRIALSARGKYFCTGMDLAKGSSPVSKGGSTSEAQHERLTRLFEAIDNAPQVTIACVQGPAFGGGVGLVFACDIRIMAKNAHMTLSEVKLGLCPATISKYVIREWGAAFAREAILSGRTVSASELAQLGKVVQVVETETELPLVLDQYLTRLKTSAPRASAMGKDLVRLSWLDGGGGEKQAQGIRRLFIEMMAEGAEAAFGLKQFQAGNKSVHWDGYALANSGVKAKL